MFRTCPSTRIIFYSEKYEQSLLIQFKTGDNPHKKRASPKESPPQTYHSSQRFTSRHDSGNMEFNSERPDKSRTSPSLLRRSIDETPLRKSRNATKEYEEEMRALQCEDTPTTSPLGLVCNTVTEETGPLKYNSEDIDRQAKIDIIQHTFEDGLKAPSWLSDAETPFKWALPLQRILIYFALYKKLKDYKNQGSFYGFEKFAILLVLILKRVDYRIEHANDSTEEETEVDDKSNDENNAIGKEKDGSEGDGEEYKYELEEALIKCEETLQEMAVNKDVIYIRIGPVFHHVLQATKAQLLFFEGKIAESKELAKNIQDVESMSLQCKAGIEGLKVKFIMSLYQDYIVLLPLLAKAVDLDPQFGYWHYLTGKVIRKLRRDNNGNITNEELESFKRAVRLERNPKFLVFFAQACQEMANLLNQSRNPSLKDKINDMLQESVDLYSECWSLKNDSASISRRVGNGMLKMRGRYVNPQLAKDALLKSAELSPKGGTYLPLGKYYYNQEKDDEKALEFFKKEAPSSFATPEIIRLNLIKDPNYDPHDELLAWVKSVQGNLKRQSAYCDSGWYYLMYKNNLEESVKCFWEVLKMDHESSKKVMEFRSHGFLVEDPINMVEVLVNEILLLRERNESLPPEDKKDLAYLENFLEKVLEKHDLHNMSPKPYLKEELKIQIESKIASKRNNRYGIQFNKMAHNQNVPECGDRRNNRPNIGIRGNKDQEEVFSRRYQWHSSNNREDNRRSDMQTRHCVQDDDRRNTGYSRDDRRINSESQCNWSRQRTSNIREGTNNQSETNSRFFYASRGRPERQHSSYNNTRYDVTISDWRAKPKGNEGTS